MAASVGLQALVHGTYDDLCRPCVDCGLYKGCFCDGLPGRGMCLASAAGAPSEQSADGQSTSLVNSEMLLRRILLWLRAPA